MAKSPVAIIGGGVSGLATAFYLGRRGIRSVLIEKSGRLGGLIKTDYVEGCHLEAGPDSFIATKPSVASLAGDLSALSQQIIGSNDGARRVFIGRRGKLVPMPRGMSMMVPGDWASALRSPLFSIGTKATFLLEYFKRPQPIITDISVEEFVRNHFGTEVLQYVADPLLCGVYGGHVEKLSARSVLPRFVEQQEKQGSLIRAVRNNAPQTTHNGSLFRSFANGMQTLTDALANSLEPQTAVIAGEVTSVQHCGSAWRIEFNGEVLEAEHLVCACPAHSIAKLVENVTPELGSELSAIPYSSAILVTLVYDRHSLQHSLEGFGFLIPRLERRSIAAATWVSTKFPSRTPSHLAAIRAFIVGDEAMSLMNAPDLEIVDLVKAELDRWMGLTANPRFHTLYRWPHSMPQYIVGHQQRQNRMEGLLREQPNLFLVGNAYDGVGIPDCIRRAKTTAEAIVSLVSI